MRTKNLNSDLMRKPQALRRDSRMLRLEPRDNTDQIEPNERRLRREPAEATENADRNEPIEPTERAEPTLPTERMEFFEAMERIEFSEANDHREDAGGFILATVAPALGMPPPEVAQIPRLIPQTHGPTSRRVAVLRR